MGLPNINIVFQEQANTAIERGARGIVALILKDSVHKGLNSYTGVEEIPTDLSAYNQNQLQLAFMGAPSKVISYVEPLASQDYNEAMTQLETTKFNYLAIPGVSSADATIITSWVKGLRDNKDIKIKAVLPNTVGDHEGIINFATDNIVVGLTTYSAKDYCSRMAGLLAGLPLTVSSTYQVLSEVSDVPHLAKSDFDAAIDSGKLVLINDGTKVKIARGVNSLQTLANSKGVEYKKIKIVDTMDMLHDDIKMTIGDNYIGKVPNIYDNKCMLITAIQSYFEGLEEQEILDPGKNTVGIDLNVQKLFLQSKGVDVSALKEQDIKEANTQDKVFLQANIKIVDAMEDISINVVI